MRTNDPDDDDDDDDCYVTTKTASSQFPALPRVEDQYFQRDVSLYNR